MDSVNKIYKVHEHAAAGAQPDSHRSKCRLGMPDVEQWRVRAWLFKGYAVWAASESDLPLGGSWLSSRDSGDDSQRKMRGK